MQEDINYLLSYKDRQVVLNYFEDEGLIDKNGFFFNEIQIMNSELKFIKDAEFIEIINLNNFPNFHKGETYKNYFYLSNNKNEKIEIYFP